MEEGGEGWADGFIWVLLIIIFIGRMSNKPAETKKPFFSCCSAEEEKKEAYVDLGTKTYSSPPPFYEAPIIVSTQVKPRIRFSYLAPVEENKVLSSSYKSQLRP